MKLPRLTKRGVYHPVELLEFIDQCIAENIPNWKIAEMLGVSLDRIIYATGEGYAYFQRQASIYRMVERGLAA